MDLGHSHRIPWMNPFTMAEDMFELDVPGTERLIDGM
jgi:hypothetical protein